MLFYEVGSNPSITIDWFSAVPVALENNRKIVQKFIMPESVNGTITEDRETC